MSIKQRNKYIIGSRNIFGLFEILPRLLMYGPKWTDTQDLQEVVQIHHTETLSV